jgi:phosphatidylethanolamine/phosphatidyl-N-methylethanolamine N-methyltransferase
MKKDLILKTKTDLPATMALTLVLWLCSLVLVGLVVAPLFGPRSLDCGDRAAAGLHDALLGRLRLPPGRSQEGWIALRIRMVCNDTIDPQATAVTRVRYDRNARRYDRMTCCTERLMTPGRAGLWQRVRGPQVLEVGVGTGKSFPYYPAGMAITAIDFSPRMIEQAQMRAEQNQIVVELREADVQALPFPDASFDTAIASCVFCSVPDPLLGLRELRRVLVPGGQLLLLEHVLSHRPLLRRVMNLINPLVVRRMGANINRETVENVRRAGFAELQVEDLWLDIVQRIEARTPRLTAA